MDRAQGRRIRTWTVLSLLPLFGPGPILQGWLHKVQSLLSLIRIYSVSLGTERFTKGSVSHLLPETHDQEGGEG